MKKIMFSDKYALTQAVLDGCKTMTRRIAFDRNIEKPNVCYGLEGKHKDNCVLCDWNKIIAVSAYKVGEVVAIAQSYLQVSTEMLKANLAFCLDVPSENNGWKNKMFVKADLMPHHIRITNIRVERLQDISDEDCLREGIFNTRPTSAMFGWNFDTYFNTPREAFSILIDKVSGKGTWEKNPYCFCYTFNLID